METPRTDQTIIDPAVQVTEFVTEENLFIFYLSVKPIVRQIAFCTLTEVVVFVFLFRPED